MTAPDCRACGLCCIPAYEDETFVDLTEADLQRLGPRRVRLTVLNSVGRAAFRTVTRTVQAGSLAGATVCACPHLRGSPGHRVSCRIYDDRPRACRVAIRPGDAGCRAIRRRIFVNA